MRRLKNILIIFICFLMLCGFSNETNLLDESYNLKSTTQNVGTSSFPSSYDSRNYISTFNNQSSENQSILSICWAFASNNVMEAKLNKQNKTYNFSENQPEYVARYLGDISKFGDPNSTFNVVKYMFYNLTPIEESVFGAYFTNNQSKSIDKYMNTNAVKFDVANVKLFSQTPLDTILNKGSESAILSEMASNNEKLKNYIYNHGAIMGIIHAVFLRPKTELQNGYGWCYDDGSRSDNEYTDSAHAITIIGWDDNYVWNGTGAAPYKGAWLAANSWGTDRTFFYISYFDASIARGTIGVSEINNNDSGAKYNNTYLVAESDTFTRFYEDNREKYYKRTQTSTTSETYTYYIGDDTEKVVGAKVLYFGFDNSNYIINNMSVKVEVSGNGNTTYNTMTLLPGITSYSLTSKEVSGTVTVKVSITNPTSLDISHMYYAVMLLTKGTNTSGKIFVNSSNGNYSNVLNGENSFNIVTKNIIPTAKGSVTVKVLDASSNDITSKFTVTKNDFVFNSSKVVLKQKELLSTSAITLKVTGGGVTGSKTYNLSGSGYTISTYTLDTVNKVVKNISPNTTVSTLVSKVSGATAKVYDKNNTQLNESTKLATGYKLKINNDTYDISVLGDLTGDGYINVSDIMKLQVHIIKNNQLTTQTLIASADVNKDGNTNIGDIMKISNFIIKGAGL